MTFDPGRVQAIFLAAFNQVTPADRLAVLDRECGNDEEVRRRVEALLIAHDKTDGLLGRPFIALGEQIESIRKQRVDSADEGEPRASQQERQP